MTPPAGNAKTLMTRFDTRETGAQPRGRAVLVALPPDVMPPIAFGRTILQHIRVVLIDRRRIPELAASNPVLGEVPRFVLPAGAPPEMAPVLKHARRLRGEILCDESGRFYEKVGSHVRPVRQLAAGPDGEIVDMAPPPPSEAPETIDVPVTRRRIRQRAALPARDMANAPEEDDQVPMASHRALALASGHHRIVRFGAYRAMLAPQLLHPERLRDAHRLACRLHVYECLRAQPLESLAAAIFGDETARPLCPLTPESAAALDATDLVFRRSTPPHDQRGGGLVFPRERVFWLEVTVDPTSSVAPLPEGPPRPAATPASSAVAEAQDPTTALKRKTTIPDRFLGPWEFKVGRDEAVFDMHEQAARGRMRSWLARCFEPSMKSEHVRKWQVLLAGKGFDEQLWGVRPPRGGLTHQTVRDWARATLEAAGYDVGAMLSEWEIYWRRKGL